MSDTINLAGKDIIVDHVTTQDGSDTLRALQLMNAKRNRNGVDSITGGTCRIGARASGTTLDVYAYNPLNAYSTDFGDDYYVNTGYVNCNGQSCPVFIPGKHIGRAMPSGKYGTWAIIIHKASALDEVWSVNVAMPEPDDGVMVWTDWENHVVSIDTDVWVIGSFLFNEDENLTARISNVFMHSEGQTPETFLKNRFMQIMNDCDGVDTADYTAWAVAMKCDAIFKRMAVLTAFVNYLIANNLKVGPGSGEADSGFRFRCLSDDGNGDPIFDIYFDDKELFKVDISSGKIYFGTGFWYDPDGGAIHSQNDGVIIDSGGIITINNGVYRSLLSCASFSSMPRKTIPSPTQISIPASNAETQYRTLGNSSIPQDGSTLACTHSSDSLIRYVSCVPHTSFAADTYYFYDKNLNVRGSVYAFQGSQHSGRTYSSTWANTSFTVTYGIVSNDVFKLVNKNDEVSIGTYSSSLESGELYYTSDGAGTGTGTVHVKL